VHRPAEEDVGIAVEDEGELEAGLDQPVAYALLARGIKKGVTAQAASTRSSGSSFSIDDAGISVSRASMAAMRGMSC